MPKSCCAVGCSNRSSMKWKKLSFYTFPKDPERWELWVDAIKRINTDGTKWRPSKDTVLCSKHFISGKPTRDKNNPDYVPSLFKHCYCDMRTINFKPTKRTVKISRASPPPPAKRLALDQNENIPKYSVSPILNVSKPSEEINRQVSSIDQKQMYCKMVYDNTERDNVRIQNAKLPENIKMKASLVDGELQDTDKITMRESVMEDNLQNVDNVKMTLSSVEGKLQDNVKNIKNATSMDEKLQDVDNVKMNASSVEDRKLNLFLEKVGEVEDLLWRLSDSLDSWIHRSESTPAD